MVLKDMDLTPRTVGKSRTWTNEMAWRVKANGQPNNLEFDACTPHDQRRELFSSFHICAVTCMCIYTTYAYIYTHRFFLSLFKQDMVACTYNPNAERQKQEGVWELTGQPA